MLLLRAKIIGSIVTNMQSYGDHISLHKLHRLPTYLIRCTFTFKGVLLDAKNMLRISSVSNEKYIRAQTCISPENDYSSH